MGLKQPVSIPCRKKMDTPQSTLSYLLVLIYREQLHQNGFSKYEFTAFSIYMGTKPNLFSVRLIIYYQLSSRNAVGEGNTWLEDLCQACP